MLKIAYVTAGLAFTCLAPAGFAATTDAPAAPVPAQVPQTSTTTTATTSPPGAETAPAGVATATVRPTAGPASERNPLLADNGEVRASKLIGTNVYNTQDQQLGSVNDVLVGQNGQVSVILSANGKKVAVPWNKLEFGNAKLNSNNKAIMPNETQQALKQMPAFKYTTGKD